MDAPDPQPQEFSHHPAIPPPTRVRLVMLEEHDCSYLPGRVARMRGLLASEADPDVYERFMDAGFRRSGRLIYQPVCAGCRACVPMRIDTFAFVASKSQRRILRRNEDLRVDVAEPTLTDEKLDLYRRYLAGQHDRTPAPDVEDDLRSFLYDSPVPTAEMTYRDPAGRLIAVGILDVTPDVLSSVYFFWDPACRDRSPGVFGMLRELATARASGRRWYHLGYWVEGAPTMDYKSHLADHHLLGTDGVWRPALRHR